LAVIDLSKAGTSIDRDKNILIGGYSKYEFVNEEGKRKNKATLYGEKVFKKAPKSYNLKDFDTTFINYNPVIDNLPKTTKSGFEWRYGGSFSLTDYLDTRSGDYTSGNYNQRILEACKYLCDYFAEKTSEEKKSTGF
jgi:hypothetical protein